MRNSTVWIFVLKQAQFAQGNQQGRALIFLMIFLPDAHHTSPNSPGPRGHHQGPHQEKTTV